MLERIQFIKVNRHKRYAYEPRYFNERKERLNSLIEKYKKEEKETDISSAAYRARIKQRIEQSWDMNAAKSNHARSANVRLVIILIALLLLTYFVLDYVSLFSADVTSIDNPEITN